VPEHRQARLVAIPTGIGNVYKAETLFLRGVNPWRPVGEVADLTAFAE
jgi:endonuclease VIII